MASPYVGEIRMFAGNFAPRQWLFCDGQVVSIAEHETLFQAIGFTYGGDGEMLFALPNLQGRLPIHQGNGFAIGSAGGAEEVTLALTQIPGHTHAFMADGDDRGDQISPAGNVPAQSFNVVPYVNDVATGSFNPAAVSMTGGSLPHSNVQPYLCVNFIISTYGIFPSPV
jgi:microcystin-dependent protein